MAISTVNTTPEIGFHLNLPPQGFSPERELPAGFLDFLTPLHQRFAPRQRELVAERKRVLAESLQGEKPTHRYPAEAVRNGWRIQLPVW